MIIFSIVAGETCSAVKLFQRKRKGLCPKADRPSASQLNCIKQSSWLSVNFPSIFTTSRNKERKKKKEERQICCLISGEGSTESGRHVGRTTLISSVLDTFSFLISINCTGARCWFSENVGARQCSGCNELQRCQPGRVVSVAVCYLCCCW